MFTWSENYFMETTVSFGRLTICSAWSLSAVLLQLHALRLLICLPAEQVARFSTEPWAPGGQGPCLIHLVAHAHPAPQRESINIE